MCTFPQFSQVKYPLKFGCAKISTRTVVQAHVACTSGFKCLHSLIYNFYGISCQVLLSLLKLEGIYIYICTYISLSTKIYCTSEVSIIIIQTLTLYHIGKFIFKKNAIFEAVKMQFY